MFVSQGTIRPADSSWTDCALGEGYSVAAAVKPCASRASSVRRHTAVARSKRSFVLLMDGKEDIYTAFQQGLVGDSQGWADLYGLAAGMDH